MAPPINPATGKPYTLQEYAELQQQANRAAQPGYQPPPQTAPATADHYGAAKGGAMSSAGQRYDAWNRQIGVGPKDDILGSALRGDYGQAAINVAYGAPAFAAAQKAFEGPKRTYVGGSKEAMEANRAQYDQGIMAGQDASARGEGVAMYGADTAGGAADMARGTYGDASNLFGQGTAIGQSGMAGQDAALGASISAAGKNVGSLAEMQSRQMVDAQNKAMNAQAAQARGGNAAAAIRNAQDKASENQLANNQLLTQTRLKEDQDRQIRIADAQSRAAAQYGDRATMGYNSAAQGLGAQNTATGQVNTAGSTIGGIGGDIMGSGNQQQSTYVNAEIESNKAQNTADQAYRENKQKSKDKWLDKVGSAIGGMFGGGGMF
jgi:hypothetical protein